MPYQPTTTFIPLPVTLRRPVEGGCSCPWCKSHPHNKPTWDTLAWDGVTSWTVHYPDLEAK